MRERKLYREHYPNFQTYCIKRWGISERRGLDLARSTAVAEHLLDGPAGPEGDSPLPPNLAENVMRPLSKPSNRFSLHAQTREPEALWVGPVR